VSKPLLILSVSFVLGACSLTPEYRSPESDRYRGATFVQSQSETPLETVDQISWWKRFDDATIDTLVEQAIENNLDLREAAANVLESQALVRAATGRRWPEISAGFSAERSFTGSTTGFGFTANDDRTYATTLQLGGSVAWQTDLFGRLRSAENASIADWQATLTDREALTHTVIADVIRQRVQLAIAIQRLQVAEDILNNRQRTLDIVNRRYNRGVSNTSAVDVRLARENVYAAQASIAGLEQDVALAQHALDILIGRKPRALPVTREDLNALPELDDAIAGVPAQLVDRRPDLRAAEFRVIAANERIGVAVADLYPDLTITANSGWRDSDMSDLIRPDSLFGSLLGELTKTVFAGGRLRAEVDAAEARLQAQASRYANQVLQAIREVEDALVRNHKLRERLARVNQQVSEARLAGDLSRERYARGVESLLTVLETERRRADAEDTLLRVEQDYWNARVDLHLALGGDWLDEAGQRVVAAK
jgi:multidrug efflux system outer membrane protein